MVRFLDRMILPPLVALLLAVLVAPLAMAEQGRGRFGWIEIVSGTTGADVQIDGTSVGQVPLPEKIQVPVGEHSVRVAKRGFTQLDETVAVKLRKTVTVEADLLALSGVLKVSANVEKARVFVDGEYIGDVPVEQEVDPGTKLVKVRLLGYYDFEASLDVVAGEEYEVNAELERLPPEEDPTIAEAPRRRRWYEQWWVWTIVGAVVVSAAVAIPVAITQQSDHCADTWDDVDSCADVITVIAGQAIPTTP
jgi:hypothetical protein